MNIGKLFKYILYFVILLVVLFFLVSLFIYYFSNSSSIELAYRFIVPVSIFIISILYSRSMNEKGLLRGIELWVAYIAFILITKLLTSSSQEINILQNALYLPLAIFGGILGVNMRKKQHS